MKSLPIYKYEKEIVTSIKTNPVVVITGETGCGKSTGVPIMILENLIYTKKTKVIDKIIVCTPTRISAFSLAKYVARIRGKDLGVEIGYAIGGERVSSFQNTVCEYQTVGVLKEMLLHKILLKNFSNVKEKLENVDGKNSEEQRTVYIIIDEIHEREIDQDTTLFLLKRYLRTGVLNLKIILMSATINPKIFQDYFNEFCPPSIDVRRKCVPHVHVPTKIFKVRKLYLNDLLHWNEEIRHICNFFKITEGVNLYDLLRKIYPIAVDLIEEIHFEEPFEKTILVFLPGISEIITLEKLILEKVRSKIDIHILHSCIGMREQKKVFNKGYNRKIILATNIAESSITVPTVSFVIDFCIFKELNLNFSNGVEELIMKWATKENMKQRKGRAGRTKKGKCIRLIPKSFYKKCKKQITPEIERISLSHLILKLKVMKIGSPSHILSQFITPPAEKSITKAYEELQEINGLDEKFKITSFGEFIVNLPLSLNNCAIVFLGYIFGFLDECVLLSSILELDGVMFDSFSHPLFSLRNKHFYSRDSESDIFSSYFAYISFQKEKCKSERMNIKWWCNRNGVSQRKLRDVEFKIAMVYEKMKFSELNDPFLLKTDEETVTFLKYILFGAYQKNFVVAYKTGLREIPNDFNHKYTVSIRKNPVEINGVYNFSVVKKRDVVNFIHNFDNGFGYVKKIEDDKNSEKMVFVEFSPPKKKNQMSPVTLITKFSGNDFMKKTRSKNSKFRMIPYQVAFGQVEYLFIPIFYAKKSKISRFSILSPYSHLEPNQTQTLNRSFVFISQHKFSEKRIFVSMNTSIPKKLDNVNFMLLTFLLFSRKIQLARDIGRDNYVQVIQNQSVYYFRPYLDKKIVSYINKLRLFLHKLDLRKKFVGEKAYKDMIELIKYYNAFCVKCEKEDTHGEYRIRSGLYLYNLNFVKRQRKHEQNVMRNIVNCVEKFINIGSSVKFVLVLLFFDRLIVSNSFFYKEVQNIRTKKTRISFYIDELDNIKLNVFSKGNRVMKLRSGMSAMKLDQLKFQMSRAFRKIKNKYIFVKFKTVKKKCLILKCKKKEELENDLRQRNWENKQKHHNYDRNDSDEDDNYLPNNAGYHEYSKKSNEQFDENIKFFNGSFQD